jgi:hypothetical protein
VKSNGCTDHDANGMNMPELRAEYLFTLLFGGQRIPELFPEHDEC